MSTCFSFLLDWRQSSNSNVQDGIKLGASQLQGAEVIPCSQIFENLCKELAGSKLIALCEVDSDFFGMIDAILTRKDSTEEPVRYDCHLRLQVF